MAEARDKVDELTLRGLKTTTVLSIRQSVMMAALEYHTKDHLMS